MSESFWSLDLSVWRVVVAGAFLAASLALGILGSRRARARRPAAGLEALRVAAAALLAFTALRPEHVRLTRKEAVPVVAVLCDGSGSMDTRDIVGDGRTAATRQQWLQRESTNRFWAPLEARYRVVREDFSTPPSPLPPDADPGTDLNSALEAALQKHDDLRAVLLLSDGDWNVGKPPVSAATLCRVRGIPVFAVAAGSDRFLPDLELQHVAAPAYGLMDEHISLPFTVQSRLGRDVKTTVSLRGPDGVLATKELTIPAQAQVQDSVILEPRREGEFTFSLDIPVENDEAFADNNARPFRMALRREVLKVLVIESRPRWEFRYLRNALSRDPGIQVHSLLLHPGLPVGQGAGCLASFPASKEDLSTYDVVFLGDVGMDAEGLSLEHVGAIKGLVEQQGSGLIFLPGMLGRQATLVQSPLAGLLPVQLDEAHPTGLGISVESKLALTTTGREHLLTRLAPDPLQNDAIWRSLPGFYWHAPVLRAKRGAEVLAVHSTFRNASGRIPLLVTSPAGNGKVLFMGTDSAWRWRRGVEDTYHYRFWGQVVRWMAHQRHMAQREGIRFFFSPESPRRGERVFLHATVLDRSGFPVKDAPVRVRLASASGGAEALTLTAEPGGWGVFTGSFVPVRDGDYTASVVCEAEGRALEVPIAVRSPRTERVGRPVRLDVLRELAGVTAGLCVGYADLPRAVQSIAVLPEARPAEHRLRLWCHPAWIGLVIGLLAAYWGGRKLSGMV